MATVHYVDLKLVKISTDTGAVIEKSDPIALNLRFDTQFRVVPDSSIASSAGYPTIKQYLEAEAALGYEPKAITQSFIVTYHT